MQNLLTPGNIMFAIGILGVIFSIYLYFHKPQENLERQQALAEKDIGTKATILAQKEMENKASLLAQQVDNERGANEKKFNEFSSRLNEAMALAQNHIHTVDTKVDGLTKEVSSMSKNISCELTRLSTIIEERIPKK